MIEIQIHPSDIRSKVRFFFLNRKQVVAAVGAGTALMVLMLLAVIVAPSVIRRTYRANAVRIMREERAVQLARLREHVAQLSSLERTLDEHRIKIEKLTAVYGLESPASGKGGVSVPTGFDAARQNQLLEAVTREQLLRQSVTDLQAQLERLSLYEQANAALVRHIPSILPLPLDQFVLTSPFGSRVSPFTRKTDMHRGLDLAAPQGTPVFATADGVVTFAGRVSLGTSAAWWRFGNVVVINHADRFLTIYGHCDSISTKVGAIVRQGDQIATVGSSGWSTNSHLHYEVRASFDGTANFEPIDPRIYILNYQWNNEEKLLMQSRSSRDAYRDLDPLPSAFVGRRRV